MQDGNEGLLHIVSRKESRQCTPFNDDRTEDRFLTMMFVLECNASLVGSEFWILQFHFVILVVILVIFSNPDQTKTTPSFSCVINLFDYFSPRHISHLNPIQQLAYCSRGG